VFDQQKVAALTRRQLKRDEWSENQSGVFEQRLDDFQGKYSEKVGESEDTIVKAAAC